MKVNRIIQGDTLLELKKLPSNLVDTIITSPPYWGLRDYGVKGQIGLEKTLDEYINKLLKITKELKRILKPTGVMFWNHSDNYGGTAAKGNWRDPKNPKGRNQTQGLTAKFMPKCLCLQNYRLIMKMLDQQDYEIRDEGDRKWLASLVDGEGCIAIHKRANNRKNPTYAPIIEICNTSKELIDRAQSLFNRGSRIKTKKHRNRELYRWRLMSNDARDLLTEIYPFLIAKRLQAKAALYLPSSGQLADEIWQYIKNCNQGIFKGGNYPEPKIEPRGDRWILRNVIQWWKPNHMPSSVKDRFTNAYEPVFMLVKKKKYWFDLDAVRKPHKVGPLPFNLRVRDAHTKKSFQYKATDQERKQYTEKMAGGGSKIKGHKGYYDKNGKLLISPAGKNPGDVWKISTQPFPEAHFATFPEKLITPMILSSCPKEICKKCGKARERIIKKELINIRKHKLYTGVARESVDKNDPHYMPAAFARTGVQGENKYTTIGWTDCNCKAGWKAGIVLDPFIGSGTVAIVAKRFMRNYLGIELNPEYIKIAKQRIRGQPVPLL